MELQNQSQLPLASPKWCKWSSKMQKFGRVRQKPATHGKQRCR